ncbi:MAG: hypothetical protein HN509_11350 [Halobacteriovoraceae bacterium]|jgi:hypothetical protein|nr:hypothetical protein [Halobacteriovoraceae bacterium]MBT5093152.1 hypothetical protein [Halobacteriovoraceae bacterium]
MAPLKKYLLNYYLEKHGDDDFVTLFRGAAKDAELPTWKSGKFPRGVRYWTPDVTYAWRYARKRDNFLTDTITGRSAIMKFKIPKSEFAKMVEKKSANSGD